MKAQKKQMSCATASPAKETAKEKLARFRSVIAANPRSKIEDSPEVKQRKLEVFEDWADLRDEASKIA
jgi:hypothetical protein